MNQGNLWTGRSKQDVCPFRFVVRFYFEQLKLFAEERAAELTSLDISYSTRLGD